MKHTLFKMSVLSAAIMITLSGCGSDNDKKTAVIDIAPRANNVELTNLKHWVPVTDSLKAIDSNGDELSFSFAENGQAVAAVDGIYHFSHGTMALSGRDFTYISLTGEDASIDYTVTANGKSASAKINISGVEKDPLANEQWHLRNTGQRAFARSDEFLTVMAKLNGLTTDDEIAQYKQTRLDHFNQNLTLVGADMNVAQAYQQGVTGKGVIAVVVDSGLEVRHEDLDDNVLPYRSLNLNPGAFDQTDPTKPVPADGVYKSFGDFSDHGTAVAGLIAAEGWNGKGGRGVAPDAQLIGMNFIHSKTKQNDFNVQAIINGFPGSGIALDEEVLFNRSYGSNPALFLPDDQIDNYLTSYATTILRNGKGAISVKASGNDFESGRHSDGDFCKKSGTNELGLGCIDMNVSAANRSLNHVTVGALKANGKRASYSTSGSGLFLSAPAGESGQWEPAMITTDNMTCLNGSSGFPLLNYLEGLYGQPAGFVAGYHFFDYPGHPLNASCNYTNSMNGTSSAAPNTSGVIALVMEANPALTARDIKHVLATTATQTDPEDTPIIRTTGDGEFTAHLGWVENAAGYKFNNFYGLGRVNAGEAVKMAKGFTSLTPQVQSDWYFTGQAVDVVIGEAGPAFIAQGEPLALSVPNNSVVGASHSMLVDSDLVVEAMQFSFTIANSETRFDYSHEQIPGDMQSSAATDLAIEVTSPSGTKAIILSSGQANLTPAVASSRYFLNGFIHAPSVSFLSHAFYGENSKGEWTVKVVDAADPAQVVYLNDESKLSVVVPNETPSVLEGWGIRVTGRVE
ncbi:S8 family serine peptidase [Pseudoalteromonas tunicata]|uniref:Putative extracellular serine protease n=1 Tax=Pseudoalteromonas tunicata D2 TaxID=87626 RepID=A4CF67_9GAMM|nr:S8 family serine peptidase [Pseudoalteromonas tunicata]ATC96227.1 hypothetical protein PTUN_a3981 [Pseudoalteromonas tunicata]AXT31743.1 serine protease [Pseudoalteromonas tunicata]EAR26615.1 putative extracellular serine protease [Pseudoalteromonas tunicata D2]